MQLDSTLMLSWVVIFCNICNIATAQIIFGGGNLGVRSTTPSPVVRPICQTADMSHGTCTQIQNCPLLLQRYDHGDIDYLRRSVCGKQAGRTLLCCPDSGSSTGETAGAGDEGETQEAGTAVHTQSPRNCGHSSFTPSRVVGGEPVRSSSEFPSVVALLYRPQGERELAQQRRQYFRGLVKCGGTLVSSRHVLTAAHCISSLGPEWVRMGDVRLGTTVDDDAQFPPQQVKVSRIIKHENFQQNHGAQRSMKNDIAILVLDQELALSENIAVMCLPPHSRSISQLEHMRAHIAGWGATRWNGVVSLDMQWARVNVSSHQLCRQNYEQAGVQVHATKQLCAIGHQQDVSRRPPHCGPANATELRCQGGVDTCGGDSGGPLMMARGEDNSLRWYVEGIVSFAVGCGNPSYPGIYTRVDRYLPWIQQHMR